MLIRVERLVHTYSPGTPLERRALREVNLEIGAGERVGILGPTGSGKSTLVQHLAGVLEPPAGQVLLDGVVVCQAPCRVLLGNGDEIVDQRAQGGSFVWTIRKS